jgi:hypothetical protein
MAGCYDNPICRTGPPGYIGGEIDSSESIPGLHKRLQIRALAACPLGDKTTEEIPARMEPPPPSRLIVNIHSDISGKRVNSAYVGLTISCASPFDSPDSYPRRLKATFPPDNMSRNNYRPPPHTHFHSPFSVEKTHVSSLFPSLHLLGGGGGTCSTQREKTRHVTIFFSHIHNMKAEWRV